jgi:hypothetical protein
LGNGNRRIRWRKALEAVETALNRMSIIAPAASMSCDQILVDAPGDEGLEHGPGSPPKGVKAPLRQIGMRGAK